MRRHSTAARLSLLTLLVLAGCGTVQEHKPVAAPGGVKIPVRRDPTLPAMPAAGSGRGAYYKDDGPEDNPPANLRDVPDADVRNEPMSPRSNRPYVVLGKNYTPLTDLEPFSQRGTGTWYGKKFHGQRTSSGEIYDMYKMTAAHPTLPIPSYARVTSLDSGKQVIVRINDRGPFHASRIIDVSYTAALKLDLLAKGSHQLLVERLLPDEIDRMIARRDQPAAPVRALTPSVRIVIPPAQAIAVEPQTGSVVAPDVTALLLPSPSPSPWPVSEVASAAVVEAPAVGQGFYLQLGAYTRAENANAARSSLNAFAGRLGILEVVESAGVHRLFGGPFASRADALHAAQDLPDGLGLRALVIQR